MSSNATVGDCALELVRELFNNPDIIPRHNKDAINKCAKEINALFELNRRDLLELRSMGGGGEQEEEAMTLVRARQVAIERIKRCCLSYLHTRMERLKLRWRCGGIVSEDVKGCLSAEELAWLGAYNKQLFAFQSRIGGGRNLLDHAKPPKSITLYVKALKDYGTFDTSEGVTVTLKKGSMHLLPRLDCENLIRRGIVEQID